LGQVTLPEEVQEELDLEEGDVLEATVRDNEIALKPTLHQKSGGRLTPCSSKE
jgi:AbrB family looped-hinge helix DNA binding protein